MNPQLVPLVQLQALDLREAEIRERQRKIPERLEAAERPLREAKRQLQEASIAADKAQKARRDRERDLEAQEGQIQKLKARTTEIKKNVEYQAHLFEIQMADKKKGEIEEQVLLLMEETEQHQRVVQAATAEVTEAEGRFAQTKGELEALDAKLSAELTELDHKQRAIAQSIQKPLLDRYQKLKSTRKDLALAPVKDGTCSGCRLQLPPQLVAEVKRSDALLTCNFCHRILYWESESGSAGAAPPESLDDNKAAEDLPERV